MPPLWKINRELARSFRQILGLPRSIFDRHLGTKFYDIFLARKLKTRRGLKPGGARKAIYLMHPDNGIMPSHLRTINYLSENGLSVTVVSNLPLSPADQDLIASTCHNFIERPNFGYDFGGYRDAILAMATELATTEQLVLMNDSVWFPLHGDRDWLNDVAALNVDFAGSVSHFGFDRVEPADFRDFTFTYRTTHKNFHYGSFALSIGPKILRNPEFLAFWRKLRIANSKRKTVRYGETGLTQWVMRHGYTHGDTLGVAGLKEKLSGLNRTQLEMLVPHIISFEDRRLKDAQRQVIATLSDLSDADLVKFVLAAGSFQGVGYVLANWTVPDLGYPFLKKSPISLDEQAAQSSALLLRRIGTPAAREALVEAGL